MAVRALPRAAPTSGLAPARLWLEHRVWLIPAGVLFAWLSALALIQAPGGDESVYTLVSRGILEGRWPYRDLFDHKQPLLYAWYIPAASGAWEVQRLLGAALLAISCWPMALLARRLLGDDRRTALALAAYALVLANPFIMAGTNAEAYILLPLLGAFAAPAGLFAGLLFGLAVATKGLALVFLPALCIRWRGDSWRALAAAGAVILSITLLFAPVWRDALDANVTFNIDYAAYAGEDLGTRLLIDPWVLLASVPIWLAMLPGMLLFRNRFAWALFICGLLYVKVSPFDFAHYYAMLAPGAAIFAAVGADALLKRFRSNELSGFPRIALVATAAVACIPAVAIFIVSFAYQAATPGPYADVSAAVHRIEGELYVLGHAPQVYVQAEHMTQRRFFFSAPLAVRDNWGQDTKTALLACPPAALVVPDDDVFKLDWTAELTAVYTGRARFDHATLYSAPLQTCEQP